MRTIAHRVLLGLVLASASTAEAADFYASTTGTPGGAGTLADPWDLQTALAQTSTVQPGDTIWVRGGTYTGSFAVLLSGTAADPITVRALRRERVVLDHDSGAPCNPGAAVGCTVDASRCASLVVPECSQHVVFRDLELTYSEPSGRISVPAGGCSAAPDCCYIDGLGPPLKPECTQAPASIARAQWSTMIIEGRGVSLINCALHDGGTGLAPGYLAQDTEIYGGLVFNNGWVNPLGGAGHGIHLENRHAAFHASAKRVRDSVVWNNFGYGVYAYTPVPRLLVNVHYDGAIGFNNGAPASAFFGSDPAYAGVQGARYNNLYIDSEEPLALISVRSSHSYQPPGTAAVTGRFGSSLDNNADLIFEDNYMVGPGRPVAIDRWTSVSLAGNTLVGGGTPAVGDTETLISLLKGDCKGGPFNPDYTFWNHNQYCFTGSGTTPFLKNTFGDEFFTFAQWKAELPFDANSTYATTVPGSNAVFVQPNLYEAGRAHVVVYNWQNSSSASVNLSAAGLINGQGYKIYNLQAFDLSSPTDYFGTVVASGSFNSASPTVNVPMTDAAVTEPIGFAHAVASTLPQFGVFLVRSTPCGDGNVDAGEACDDGNLVLGDGCSVACAVEECFACSGNPSSCAPDDGAPCDDGIFCNGTDVCGGGSCGHGGDPCPADPCLACNEAGDVCQSPAGAACASDGNPCTNDQCNGAGSCVHDPNTSSCSDGNACTAPDVCGGGSCQPGSPVLVCGDGNTCGAEACDDGNGVSGDGCDTNCTASACGNGIAAGAEGCDDGNLVDGDGCDANCKPTGCGNGVVTAGEACDDANSVNGDGCDNNCTASACGNGITGGAETCDDGNLSNGDGCDANCKPTGCGNGIATPGEACDDGNPVNGDGCDTNCTVSSCGNGVPAPGEACDDGNPVEGDGCDSNCTATACGNGIRTGTESCDDGNAVAGDGCEANCTYTTINTVVAGGMTVTTDVQSTGATQQFPAHVELTTPNAGTVAISSSVGAGGAGIVVLGMEWNITAPAASASSPLQIVLTLDASIVPAGLPPARIEVTRNGAVVADCTGAPGAASPDPCVSDRTVSGAGDVAITVLTSQASAWRTIVRALSTDAQKCVNLMNLAGRKVAKAQGTAAHKCLKDAAAGRQSDPQTCLTADVLGKMLKAFQKTDAIVAAKCTATPAFGFTGAATVNAAGQEAGLDLIADLFGANLNAAVIPSAANRPAAVCQAAIAKSAAKLLDAKVKAFLKCKKHGLSGKTPLMVTALDMQACFDGVQSDSSDLMYKAYTKLVDTNNRKCAALAVPQSTAFPGACSMGDLATCFDRRADCRVCRLFNAMDGLAEDCDLFDDGLANASCD